MSDPTTDPNFSGIKMPAFDHLVGSHARATGLLDQLAHDLWVELRQVGVDASPALRVRALAGRMGSLDVDLRWRQARVHSMEQQGAGLELRTPTGTFWAVPAEPRAQPGPTQAPREKADLSDELAEAEHLSMPSVDPDGTRFSPDQDAVLSWIELNRDTILREARARNVPPEAIAAAVAWEAIENDHGILGTNWGPGKVHADEDLVHQLEARGYLPHMTDEQRAAYLKTDAGAIKYIAAIMGGFSDVTERDGRFPSIRNNIPMLTQAYQGYDLETWAQTVREKRTGTDWDPGNDMPLWLQDHPEFVHAIGEALHSGGHPRKVPG
jgi:hypothetical protein